MRIKKGLFTKEIEIEVGELLELIHSDTNDIYEEILRLIKEICRD